MKLNKLLVTKCRNIKEAQLVCDAGLTVIAGENGQGKTNLLECIFLLTGSKSFRTGRDQELVMHDEAQGRVVGEVESAGRDVRIEIAIEGAESPRRGRTARVNGVDYGRAAAIAGQFTAVVFEPNHLGLVKDGPEGRRRFLDAALCQLYPGYLGILRRYSRALAQKNALLRRYYETPEADGMLDAFDVELAASGGEMCRRRREYLAMLAPAAAKVYKELSQGAETLEIQYRPSAEDGELAARLAERRGTDIRAGFCTTGPHREDFAVVLGGTSARTFGSQGQQRSAVLALKLAEAEAARAVTGEHPVLLLDDVLSELDEGRQAYLLQEMAGRQSFVTCCDAAVFQKTAGLVVYMKDGHLVDNVP
ncbi:DNA replication/repair protein RecF [Ruminococcaceae bacterium OttesenSCG-928-O06]|nr:DNA replication/repair protein RecF [Ruminococcaceae bacterium OttesenSCG-928-O06]